MSSVFARLEPRLQAAIVSRLGWSSLRPVQELAGQALLDGQNAIVLAPTAGGKTEAAMFPVLSKLMGRDTTGLGALYVAPIKALLNNQAERLGTYTEMVGLRRFVWHGDVETAPRARFLADPADLLMTTPESLEVMLVSQKVDARALLGRVEVVVIDEVHALGGTDRGAHLMSVIERIAALAERDVQRVGLSATVGNPHELLQWLQGSSRRASVVVDPPKVPSKRELLVVHRPSLSALASDAAASARGRKSLFFCQSRKTSEAVADAMRAYGTEVFVHHGSVSKDERLLAEERFHHGRDACIVCTSTLELGIDVGDLDRVLQSEAPDTVGSFLQRMGRTGRRAGAAANTTFFCEDEDSVLQAIALVELAKRGWVESVRIDRRWWPVLVHQLLAMSLTRQGVTVESAWAHLSRVPDFADIHRAEYDRLIAWLLRDGSLRVASGRLVLGPRAEARFGRRNFMDLFAVFSSPASYTVQSGEQPIGTLGQAFVDRLVEGVSTFLLAGRAWRVDAIRHGERVIRASPAARGSQPTWGGITPSFLGFELCQEIRRVLVEDEIPAYLHPTAADVLQRRREALSDVLGTRDSVEETDDGLTWWTFAGGRINTTLKHALAAVGGEWKVTTGNFAVGVRGARRDELRAARDRLLDPEFWADDRLWNDVAKELPSYRLSKFQPLMPPWIEQEMLAAFLLDIEGAWSWLSGGGVLGRAPIRPEPGAVEPLPAEPAAPPVLPDGVEWVDSLERLAELVRVWKEVPAIGFDVETTLATRTLCLLQVSDGQRSWLIDPFAVGDLESLREVLGAPSPTKVIHNAAFERGVLIRHGIELDGVFDTLAESRRRAPGAEGGHSLRAVCARELDVEIDKTEQTGDWTSTALDRTSRVCGVGRSSGLPDLVQVGALWMIRVPVRVPSPGRKFPAPLTDTASVRSREALLNCAANCGNCRGEAMSSVFALLALTTSAPAATGVPTCFPISSSVRQLLEHGRVGAPVFVEEYSACEVRRELAPTAVAVPSELAGRPALDYVVATFAGLDPTRAYRVSARAGGWLIAPAGGPTVVDQIVDIDPGACPTVAAAERCIFQQVMEQSGRWFGHPTFKDQRHVMANAVRLDDVAVLEALRAIYAPHEVGQVVGFSMELTPWPPDRAADRYDGSFRLTWEPQDELLTPPALTTKLEPDLPPPGAPAPR